MFLEHIRGQWRRTLPAGGYPPTRVLKRVRHVCAPAVAKEPFGPSVAPTSSPAQRPDSCLSLPLRTGCPSEQERSVSPAKTLRYADHRTNPDAEDAINAFQRRVGEKKLFCLGNRSERRSFVAFQAQNCHFRSVSTEPIKTAKVDPKVPRMCLYGRCTTDVSD